MSARRRGRYKPISVAICSTYRMHVLGVGTKALRCTEHARVVPDGAHNSGNAAGCPTDLSLMLVIWGHDSCAT